MGYGTASVASAVASTAGIAGLQSVSGVAGRWKRGQAMMIHCHSPAVWEFYFFNQETYLAFLITCWLSGNLASTSK